VRNEREYEIESETKEKYEIRCEAMKSEARKEYERKLEEQS
jgi:hypothetical protein